MRTVVEVLATSSRGMKIELPGNRTNQVWLRGFQNAHTADEVAESVKEIRDSWESVVVGKQAIGMPVEFESLAAQEFGRLYEFVRRDQKRPSVLASCRISLEYDLVQEDAK